MQDEAALQAALQLSLGGGGGGGGVATETVGPGLPLDFQGMYEVFALVTHKGRSADGGHYISWVRQEKDDWLVCGPCLHITHLLFSGLFLTGLRR